MLKAQRLQRQTNRRLFLTQKELRLITRRHKSGLSPERGFFQCDPHCQHAALGISPQIQPQGHFFTGGTAELRFALPDQAVQALHLPGEGIVAQIIEIKAVSQGKQPLCFIDHPQPRRAQHMGVLDHARMRRPVRVEQRVHTEVAVVRVFSKVAAVGPVVTAAIGRWLEDAVIHKLPYTAAHQARACVDGLPVVLQVAGALPHGMRVLAQEERLGIILLPFPDHPLHGGIHLGVEVSGLRPFVPLVVYGPARVLAAHRFSHLFMDDPVARLVAQ